MNRPDPMASFAELAHSSQVEQEADNATDFYPGSKKKRRAVTHDELRDGWQDVPHMDLLDRGTRIRFYTVGVLAAALDDRLPQTVRKWELKGYIPETRFRTPGRDSRGQKRLYTRKMIEGIVDIAREEGIIGGAVNRNVSATAFPERVAKLFKTMGVSK